MRTWVKWAAVGGLALVAGQGVAADHADGSGTEGQTPAAGGDITDLYTWKKNDGSLVLIMNVGGLGGTNKLSEDVTYTFNIGRTAVGLGAATAPAADWSTVACDYVGTNLTCVLDDGTDQTSATAVFGGADGETDHLKVHADNHADEFFIFLTGLESAIADSVTYAADLGPLLGAEDSEFPGCLDATGGHPLAGTGVIPGDATISDVYVGYLTGAYDHEGAEAPAINDIADYNTTSIVVEIANAADNLKGTGGALQIWAKTDASGTEIDRMGRPAINTALGATLATPSDDHDDFQNEYNQNHDPSTWGDYIPTFVGQLGIYDGLDTVCGNNLAYGI